MRPLLPVAILCLMLAAPVPGQAQEWGIPPTVLRRGDLPDHARLLVRDLNRPVELTLVDGSRIRGKLTAVSATDLTLVMNTLPLAEMRNGINWNRITEVRVDRRVRLLEGLLVGGAAGAIGGIVTARDCDPRREVLGTEVAEPVWDSFLTGAAAGALMGLLRGWDFTLPITPQVTNLVGPLDGSSPGIRPVTRLVTSVPLWSGLLEDVEASLAAGWWYTAEMNTLRLNRPWHGYPGTSLALETVLPGRGKWWLRGRMEHFVLPRLTLSHFSWNDVIGPTAGPFDLWREYQAQRIYTGVSRPLAGPGRLPVAEVALLIGVERTTLRSGVTCANAPALDRSEQERFWRPVLYAGGSLSLIRRPDVSISLRAEAIVGNGFETARFTTPSAGEVLPGFRIRPTAIHVGFDIILPRF